MKRNLSHLFNNKGIPKGVKVFTLATSIRWFGWGFAETLIPIFLYSFSGTFAEAGLLRSTYDIGLILALPLIGIAADRVRASTLVLIGLFMYFFIGASYLLAGLTGMVMFIIIARFTNGIAYAFDSVGRSAYFRRHTPSEKVATVFGYFDTIANFWWIIAALIGIVLIKYFSIATLLFLITPTSIVAFLIVWKFRKKETELIRPITNNKIGAAAAARKISGWSWALKSLVVLNFFISCAATVVAFFLPIEVYTEGASLNMVVIFGVVATLPALFGWQLGKWFDIKGTKSFVYGLVLFAVLLFSLPFFGGYIWKLVVAFLVGLIVEFLSVGNNELITVHANPEHFGQVDGVMRSISNIGSMVGPLAVGIAMDSFGIESSYIALAVMLFILAIMFNFLNKYAFLKRRSV
ncbi:MAG: MFS transporter [Patescibacteria group bacterium]